MVARWIALISLALSVLILSSCQSREVRTTPIETRIADETTSTQDQEEEPPVTQPTHTPDPKDPDQIRIMWANSQHASTFVVSDQGENNSCARCHDRYNYLPSIEDIPESCYTCKFEVGDPPPYISEEYWKHVDCFICHRVEKKEVQPEVEWLEFALIEEYRQVSSTTELCNKCHLAEDEPEHFTVIVRGDHPDYTCTQCHNAHDLSATCTSTDCHADVVQPENSIPGHDDDHAQVSCSACHGADGLEIGFDEELRIWTTFFPMGEGKESRPFASHNIVLDAPCERCHFQGNPWGFTNTLEID